MTEILDPVAPTLPLTQPVPDWFHGMEFCHVLDLNDKAYCGINTETMSTCNGVYCGEAICPDCGAPTCPRCAQLSEIDDRLEDA